METTTTRASHVPAPTTKEILRGAQLAAQVLLAAVFCVLGAAKVTQPMPVLVQQFGWPGALSEPVVQAIGVLELLGALGLLLPALIRIRRELTRLAALSLMHLMLVAGLYHLTQREIFDLPGPLILGALAAYVAVKQPRIESFRSVARKEAPR